MLHKFDYYFSWSYSDELQDENWVERLDNGQFEVHLPAKFKTKQDDASIADWSKETNNLIESIFYFVVKHLDLSMGLNFFEFHFQNYFDKHGDGLEFLIFVQTKLTRVELKYEERKDIILEWVRRRRNDLNQISAIHQTIENKDNEFYLPQQILLLERLGIIKYLDKYKLTSTQKSILLSKMLGKNDQNIRTYLGTVSFPNKKGTCNTSSNNALIDQLFSELGIS